MNHTVAHHAFGAAPIGRTGYDRMHLAAALLYKKSQLQDSKS